MSRFDLDPTKLLDVALREASRVSLDARLQAENLSRDVNDPILPANSAARHAARTLVGRGLKVSQRLLASLQAFSATVLVALALASCGRAIAADASYAKQLGELGGREVLVAVGGTHKDDERLAAEVASALRRIDDAAAGGGPNERQSAVGMKAAKSKGNSTKRTAPGTLKGSLTSKLGGKKEGRKSERKSKR